MGQISIYGSRYSDLTPKDSIVDANILTLVISPIETMSASCFSVIDSPIASSTVFRISSVVLFIALTTTTTFLPFIYSLTTDSAACFILFPLPMDVPPNLATIIPIKIHTFIFNLKL